MNVVTLRRTVVVDKPLPEVFGYMSDFTTTNEWDPGTVQTVRQDGDGGVGTTYLNTSKFLGRETELTYRVTDLRPDQRVQLRGENKSLVSIDTITFTSVAGGTEVTYQAEFTFKGVAKLVGPLLRPALEKLGNDAEDGIRQALQRLP